MFRAPEILFYRTRSLNYDNYANSKLKIHDPDPDNYDPCNTNYPDNNINNYDPQNNKYVNHNFNNCSPNNRKSIWFFPISLVVGDSLLLILEEKKSYFRVYKCNIIQNLFLYY